MRKLKNKLKIFAFVALGMNLAIANAQDELYQNRLDNIGSAIQLKFNSSVQSYIDLYLQKGSSTSVLLGKSAYHLQTVEDSLTKYGMPVELKFLVPALSFYDNWSISEDGGSGFWQMNYITARRYGLKVNSFVDERRDFGKATSAAMHYLKDLNKEFNSWPLTIAAFYADEVEVNKAIRKADGKNDYWDIHNYLPIRHQKALPAFVAMTYLHYYNDVHKMKIQDYEPVEASTVYVAKWSTIYQLSKALETDYDQLKNLNPIFKKQVIPHTNTLYPVKIPLDKVKRFDFLGDSVYTYPEYEVTAGIVDPVKEIIPEPRVVEPANRGGSTTRNTTTSSNGGSGTKTVYYTVRQGDFLGRIADMYDVGLSSLRKWNGIRGDRINSGQRLKVYVPASKYSYYKRINTMTGAQKRQVMNKD
mgnify:CR=1 FL=1